MNISRVRNNGFTIVELLIVVVVIAILAAITIVSYNGITNRAKDSSAQSASSQAAKKMGIYYTTHTDSYPSTITDSDLALPNASNNPSPYQYSVSSDQKNILSHYYNKRN